MENNNHHIRKPEELFKEHESWAYAKLIDHEKQARIAEIFDEFSSILYARMTDEKHIGSITLCSKFYIADVRGFTLKAVSLPNEIFPWRTAKNIQFNDIYIGTEEDITPISLNSTYKGELGIIMKWLDPNFRKFLNDLGWRCGIVHHTEYGYKDVDKAIIYERQKKY